MLFVFASLESLCIQVIRARGQNAIELLCLTLLAYIVEGAQHMLREQYWGGRSAGCNNYGLTKSEQRTILGGGQVSHLQQLL